LVAWSLLIAVAMTFYEIVAIIVLLLVVEVAAAVGWIFGGAAGAVQGGAAAGGGLLALSVILRASLALSEHWRLVRIHRSLTPHFGPYESAEQSSTWDALKDSLKVGTCVHGQIVITTQDGALRRRFMDIGVGFPAVLHDLNASPDAPSSHLAVVAFNDSARWVLLADRPVSVG
jgi:hypothetical protein